MSVNAFSAPREQPREVGMKIPNSFRKVKVRTSDKKIFMATLKSKLLLRALPKKRLHTEH